MLNYILKRIILMIPVVIGVLLIIFILSTITPGDPTDVIVGVDATEEARDAARADYGLDKPVLVRFINYVIGVFTRADLGKSYATRQPVSKEIFTRFPVTIKLTFLSVLVALVIALPVGVLSAVKQYSWIDNISMAGSLIFVSVPGFWMALMLLLLFAVRWGILPASGIKSWMGWILPVASIGIGNVGSLARVTRSSMLEIIRQDYMRTARAKGQKYSVVIFKHGLRNALMPVISSVGNTICVSMGGVVVAESIFSLNGVGLYMLSSINARDWPCVQGGIVVLSISVSIIMLIVDIIYTIVDPRLKTEFQKKNKARRKKEAVA